MKKFLIRIMSLSMLLSSVSQAQFLTISNEDEYTNALNNHKNMIVEFSADWCNVCNGINEPFQEIAQEPEFQQVAFAKIDVDKLDGISKKNGIVGVPTFLYVEGGQKKVEEIGVQNMPAFKDHLRENIRKNFTLAQNEVSQEIAPQAATEQIVVDIEAPAPAPVQEPSNIFVSVFMGIKNFILLIIMKIAGFFTTIVDAIKGFFAG